MSADKIIERSVGVYLKNSRTAQWVCEECSVPHVELKNFLAPFIPTKMKTFHRHLTLETNLASKVIRVLKMIRNENLSMSATWYKTDSRVGKKWVTNFKWKGLSERSQRFTGGTENKFHRGTFCDAGHFPFLWWPICDTSGSLVISSWPAYDWTETSRSRAGHNPLVGHHKSCTNEVESALRRRTFAASPIFRKQKNGRGQQK